MKKFTKSLMVLICVMVLLNISAYGAEVSSVMNTGTTEDAITLFVKDEGESVEHIYIGNEECSDYSVSEAGSVRTVVVVDNSLSIREKYRSEIKSFLTELVAARNDGDTFTIATFSEDITYLVQESNDYLDIKNKIEAFSFVNQDSFFTKTLYSVIDELNKSEEVKYTRVIIIADGADDEALGYTDAELHKRIQAVQMPIYTIGCSADNNAENLKRMFALSRMTNARDYLMDNMSMEEILSDILSDNKIIRIDLKPSKDLCDGTIKSVRIDFGGNYCTTQLKMPFKAVAATEISDSEEEIEETVETDREAKEVKSDADTEIKIPWILVIAGVIIIGIITVIAVMLSKKNKKAPEHDIKDLSNIGHSKSTVALSENPGLKTELIGSSHVQDTEGTVILSGNKSVKLCLKDIHNSERTFEYPIRDKVLIGKDESRCQIVINYSKYVSSVHCEVILKGNAFVVRDGGDNVIASTNGTFVNDKKAAPELPLSNGSILKLGELSFKVTFR